MIKTDKIYILSLNNLGEVKTFAIMHNTPERVATYLLGRNVDLHMLCRPNHPSIILQEHSHGKMMTEVAHWLKPSKKWVRRTDLLEIRPAADGEMVAPGQFSESGDMIVERTWPGGDFLVRGEDFAGDYVEVVPDA